MTIVHETDTARLETFIAHIAAGGKVEASVPGLIRVCLGAPGTPYEIRRGLLGVLGLRRRSGLIEMYLRLEPAEQRQSRFH